jgi:capsular polysaccharide transport system permease protein
VSTQTPGEKQPAVIPPPASQPAASQPPASQPPASQSGSGHPDPVLSLEARKLEKQREREAALERLEELKDAKVRERIAAFERLDEDAVIVASKPSNQPIVRPAGPAGQNPQTPTPIHLAPPVPMARRRKRHWGLIFSFLLMVVAPVAISGWYLWTRATDRYVSYAGFSVRTEKISSALDFLGGVAALSGSSSSSDTDILYQFIQSHELVAKINDRLDLQALWAKADPARDPIFAYHPPGTIEDLVDYWRGMVKVYNDSGLIDVQVEAFTPQDAQDIAQMIYDESSLMINRLSDIAHEDGTRYAREERDVAVEQLKTARAALTQFRNRTQIVDPAASVQNQMGLLSSLQAQLAATLIDLDILKQTTAESDPRIVQAELRVTVIEERIQEERNKLGIGAGADPAAGAAFADLLGEYERLSVDLEFAQQTYTVALATYDAALAESRRQSRYLAAHVQPTLAEAPEQPRRVELLSLVAVFSFLIWAILSLVAYSLKDRR